MFQNMPSGYNSEDKIFIAVDCIIFGFDGNELKVLLVKRDLEPKKGEWSLIGGFMENGETLDRAAQRVLQKLTGVHNIFMEQFYAYSEVERDPVARTISVSYFALINTEKHNEKLIKSHSAKWFPVSKTPELIFDHNEMLSKAMRRLRRRAATDILGFKLLPAKFTMLQLQKLYEAILAQPLDKRNFINKINSMDVLIKLDEKDKTSSKKGSYLYMFDKEKYNSKVNNQFNLQSGIEIKG